MKHVPHLGKLIVVVLLIGLVAVGCSKAAPTPAPAPTQAPAAQTLPTTVPEPTTAPEPTAVPTAAPTPTAVPTAAPTAAPPAAKLEILAVPGNIKDANAITGTVKYMTDTTVGPKTATVALFSSGLPNVPISVPVHLSVTAADPASKVMTATWTLTAPDGSKAKIKDSKSLTITEFMPDLAGAYKVDVVLANQSGNGELASVTVHAGTYVGETACNCKQCHADKVAEVAKTGHSHIESDLMDNKRTPDVATHYAETCVRCHTTGYYPGAANGGYASVEAKAQYTLPTFKAIDAAGKGGASNFAAMPAAVKAMANIQCEDCHGPAGQHVTTGAKMATSMDNGVCYQCHNGGGNHLKGTDIQASAHSAKTDQAWTVPVGPAEQACVRCHSGAGYVSFLAAPDQPAAWNNTMQTVGCSTCHDPHSDANAWQLRIVGKPVQITFDAKNQGLSATCEECHNNRTQAANAVKGSYPHYSSAAEVLNDTGGVDYGQKLPSSPHATMVGQQPIPNPAAASDPTLAKFLFSKPDDKTGQIPGPCVACHMYPTPTDPKDPATVATHQIGSHSFNMVSPDGKTAFTAPCKSCHTDIKDTFNFTAKADYDGNGKIEGVQDEVKGLLNVLWGALEQNGLKKINTGYPYASVPTDASDKVKNAFYNFRIVYGVMWGEDDPGNQGAASAIHNFNRSVGLLQASYKDLTGNDVPGATILK